MKAKFISTRYAGYFNKICEVIKLTKTETLIKFDDSPHLYIVHENDLELL